MATAPAPESHPIAARTARSLTVEKALQLLHVVAEQSSPVSLVALSKAANLDKTTTHRLATSLSRQGLLRFDASARAYSLGLGLVELGNRAIAQLSLPREARPILEQLGALSREMVNLGVWDDGQIVYVDQLPSSEPVILRARVGTRVPAFCTGMGKVILAFGAPERREQILGRAKLPALTPNTITEPDELREHLARVRRLGYALDDEEHRLGVRCVAAPVCDYSGFATAAISIAGPSFRLSRDRLSELVQPLLEATRSLSRVLGYREDAAPVSS